jgi:hypothetical protein
LESLKASPQAGLQFLWGEKIGYWPMLSDPSNLFTLLRSYLSHRLQTSVVQQVRE